MSDWLKHKSEVEDLIADARGLVVLMNLAAESVGEGARQRDAIILTMGTVEDKLDRLEAVLFPGNAKDEAADAKAG